MGLNWDIFCRVIDNFGDIGVAWRLARDLTERGETVRLWLDDASALQWMAAGEAMPAGISVRRWEDSLNEAEVGDVVIETFGCELPEPFVARMVTCIKPPRWINLEYLSAEPYVERSHGLSSPQFSGPGRGLTKQFFYPGFTARTGGLLREPGLLAEQSRFDAQAWLARLGDRQIERRPGERIVSLFAYANPALPDLLAALATEPTLLLVCPGAAQAQLFELQCTQKLPTANLRWQALPYLSQPEYDCLLWACDLNFVRGEDSFVRAQWAGRPFVWQIYPQHDGAHGPKLEAFLALYLADCDADLAQQTGSLWRGWNGLVTWDGALPELSASGAQALKWREHLTSQLDLTTQLLGLAYKSS
ncbi:elongation factor P maturation arginine rhamnosyltransferase EarP [Roseateles sp.]|uniref:elongation factor P maturation arginine rhamnosyltransferase EarP n=1 Tax=Roseateles sp. TaxID=1971397 RepID=UPI00286C64E1|nr:elongation factor P maturation arginine rhamnosyltransferase EarP [Roseateles sp.]